MGRYPRQGECLPLKFGLTARAMKRRYATSHALHVGATSASGMCTLVVAPQPHSYSARASSYPPGTRIWV